MDTAVANLQAFLAGEAVNVVNMQTEEMQSGKKRSRSAGGLR